MKFLTGMARLHFPNICQFPIKYGNRIPKLIEVIGWINEMVKIENDNRLILKKWQN